MTACLLILSSLAALSNSSSMDAVKSTLTRWMGFIIRPELVKNRETSRPLSAIRAMLSADAGFFLPRMVVIEFSFFPGCLPQGHQMVELSFRILPNLINHRVQALTYLANGAMLNREVRTLVGVVRDERKPPALPRSRFRASGLPKTFALSAHRSGIAQGITVIPQPRRENRLQTQRETPSSCGA